MKRVPVTLFTLALAASSLSAQDRYSVSDEPAAAGNHIAFNLPFVKGSDAAKMTLKTPSTVQLLRNAKGVLSGEEKPRSFQTPRQPGKDWKWRLELQVDGPWPPSFAGIETIGTDFGFVEGPVWSKAPCGFRTAALCSIKI